MIETHKTPADGAGRNIGRPDGVTEAPDGGETHGRVGGGESSGGAYPNPHTGKKPTGSGGMGHGGQTIIDYHGGANPNATTGKPTANGDATLAAPSANVEPRHLAVSGNPIVVLEEDGVAAAEAKDASNA